LAVESLRKPLICKAKAGDFTQSGIKTAVYTLTIAEPPALPTLKLSLWCPGFALVVAVPPQF